MTVNLKADRWVNGAVANLPGVQAYLDNLTFDMLAKARVGLVEHHYDGDASVDRSRANGKYGHVDWLITLSDQRGQKAALSIEYGHGEYTRTVYPKNGGKPFQITVPASAPTYILTNATRLPRKGKRVPGKDLK